MKRWSLFVAFVIFLSVNAEIRLAFEVCRHGARTPRWISALDHERWPYGKLSIKGQLTENGMRQHYLIGRELRRRYVNEAGLLSPTYDPNQIWVRSTDYDRTMQSAISQLSGLYPLGSGPTMRMTPPQWSNKTLPPFPVRDADEVVERLSDYTLPGRFQPIPIHTIDVLQDNMLMGYAPKNCPRIGQLMKQITESRRWRELEEVTYRPYLTQLAEVLGLKSVSLLGVKDPYEMVMCNIGDNRPLVPGFTPQLVEKVEEMYGQQLVANFYNHEMRSLSVGVLFENIINKMKAQLDGDLKQSPPDLKFAFYSAHDGTVAAILSALDIWNQRNPPFASTVIFELHKGKGPEGSPSSYFVRVIFNGMLARVNGCSSTDCPYEEFSDMMARYFIGDVKEACKAQPESNEPIVVTA